MGSTVKIKDYFGDWWKWRNESVLARWMCRTLIQHRRKGLNNPYIG
jgi:hypothetical protein